MADSCGPRLKFHGHPLTDYLSRPQPEFGWTERARRESHAGVWTTLHVVSQSWQGLQWEHRLDVLVPDGTALADGGPAFLYVTGDWDDGAALEMVERLVLQAGTAAPMAAVLYDVPNQPLFGDLTEDALIAFTFVRYLESGDATWPLLFPMVKSASAALTAIQEWSKDRLSRTVERFVISGASKRGWTSWLLGAVDERAAGIAPLVYNNLNLPAQMQRQLTSFHEYSEEIDDYVAAGLPEQMNTPEGQQLVAMVDPYFLRQHLTLPKLLVHGSNDRYWPVDAAGLYLDGLPGENRVLTVPNNGHSLEDGARVLRTMAAFLRSVQLGTPLPKLNANFSGRNWDCTMEIGWDTAPVAGRAWTAIAPDQDFRASFWTAEEFQVGGRGAQFTRKLPPSGFLALFAELDFGESGRRYSLTTSPVVLPSAPE